MPEGKGLVKRPWREVMDDLNFIPSGFGGRKGIVGDVEYSLIDHPLRGVAVIGSCVTARTAGLIESSMPAELSVKDALDCLQKIYDVFHRVPPQEPPTEPVRHRPSKEEVIERIPGLLQQIYRASVVAGSGFGKDGETIAK